MCEEAMQSRNRENVHVCNLCDLKHRDDSNENLSALNKMKTISKLN